MGQKLAKKDVEIALQKYQEHDQQGAVKRWKTALQRLDNKEDRFTTLGYLALAHYDAGKYRDMLAYSVHQIEIGNDLENAWMRSEAYLNLARCNERLCEYHKAISYCRHSLQNQPRDPRVHGQAHLCQGNAHLGFSNYSRALECYEQALRISKQEEDLGLELQVYTGLGHLFSNLKDYNKGLGFHLKAAETCKTLQASKCYQRHHRWTHFNLAYPYRKLGRLTEALECSEEAMKLAIDQGDRPLQAKCLCSIANIHRRRRDIMHAFPNYESAMKIMVDLGDRNGQVDVLVGMAKNMVILKELTKVCECKALEYYNKALDLAQSIGSKMHQYRCHLRMEGLYRSLSDYDMVEMESTRGQQLLKDMELLCPVCLQAMGDKPDRLEALPCSHIIHSRCAVHLSKLSNSRPGSRIGQCPQCRRVMSPRVPLC